jgi:hypothetical protein
MFTKLLVISWMFSAGMFPAVKATLYTEVGNAGFSVEYPVSTHVEAIFQTAVMGYSNILKDDALYKGVISSGVSIANMHFTMGIKSIKSRTLYTVPYGQFCVKIIPHY